MVADAAAVMRRGCGSVRHMPTAAVNGIQVSYWDSARDVLALLAHLGIERAVLGGMSQGGFLSLRAALLAPQRVRGLILIDSQAGTEAEASRPGYEQLHQTWLDQGPGPVQELVAAIILGPGQWDGWYAKWGGRDA